MILEIYIFLMFISIGFIILSFSMEKDFTKIDTAIILRFIGTITLMLLGLNMFQGEIEYKSGDIINETSSTITIITHTYTSYTNTTLGVMLAILGAFGFAYTWFEIRQARRSNEDE